MKKITERLVKELANRDYKELAKLVKKLTFEEALKKLNGFNMETNTWVMGDKKEYVATTISFDFNFKSLNGTIFRTPNNKCELHEFFDIWLDTISTPIAKCEVDFKGNVDKVELY